MSAFTDIARKLPSDPELALVTFADKSLEAYSKLRSDLSADDAVFITRFVDTFVQKFKIDISFSIPRTAPAAEGAVKRLVQIREHKAKLVSKSVDAEIRDILETYTQAAQETFGLAHLNEDEKKKILAHLEKVRSIVEESDLADRKKNALFERLSDLVREVNTHGTRTDRFFAFAGDVGFVLGDMTKKAKPLIKEVKEILRIVGRSRARQEGVSLPPGDEVLQLPPPSNDSNSTEE